MLHGRPIIATVSMKDIIALLRYQEEVTHTVRDIITTGEWSSTSVLFYYLQKEGLGNNGYFLRVTEKKLPSFFDIALDLQR